MNKYITSPRASKKMPKGIPYIIGNELAERFSFYGMKCILVVFMTKYLVDQQGNHAPMSNEEATAWYHWFTSAVYFTPLLGAIISNNLAFEKVENFIEGKILGKVFPAPVEYRNKTYTAETDLEALNIGINSEKKSIEVLSQLVAGEKKMDVRVIFNHLLTEEKKHLMVLEELKQTLIKE